MIGLLRQIKNHCKNICKKVAKKLDIKLKWTGKGEREKGIDQESKKVIVEIDKKYFRPLRWISKRRFL